MPNRFIALSILIPERRHYPLLAMDMLLAFALCVLPNLLISFSFVYTAKITPAAPSAGWTHRMGLLLGAIDLQSIFLWITVNCILMLLLFMLRRHIFHPLVGLIRQMYGMLGVITHGTTPHPVPALFNMRMIMGDLTRMAQLAHEYYLKHQEASFALKQARELIGQIVTQQTAIVASASREMLVQYQSVLAYANYLEERIAQHTVDPSLRYDFDEVSESSFNLKLIAGSLSLLKNQHPSQTTRIDIPMVMQQTMLALAPSLDRRSMKLTTAEVELSVMAMSDPAIIAHVLWMMLLGTIRYAADESTLRLRCFYNHERTRALISIVVSELSPGRLSEQEREALIARQLQHLTPHMFAETIRIHANMQLAEMLLAQLDGNLSILPITSQSCEICLSLPVPEAMDA